MILSFDKDATYALISPYIRPPWSQEMLVNKLSASLLAATFLISSCGPSDSNNNTSETKALSSNDWFKNGVDRFYLAKVSSTLKISEDHDATYGDRFFIGIGCYGEDKDPQKLVEVPKEKGSQDTIKIPLNRRTMVYQFNLAEEGEKPKKGQCKILIGDPITPQQISNGADLSNKNTTFGTSAVMTTSKVTVGVLSCFSFVASTVKFAGVVAAGGYATAQTGGVAAPLVIPAIITDAASVASSAMFCGLWVKWAGESVHNFKISENQSLFSNALSKAAKLTAQHMEITGTLKTYNELLLSQDPKNIAVASAIWNRTFIEVFNLQVTDKFENGWGGETKFFDAVTKVKTEYLSAGATYQR